MDSELDLFKIDDCLKYKVFTEIISCEKRELVVNQYLGMYEDMQDHKLGKITDKKYIDIYNNEGEDICLYNLNADEYNKLSKQVSKLKEQSKRFKEIGKKIEANTINSNLEESNTWISELCNWFIKNEYEIPSSKNKKLPKYKEYEILFNKFYNDTNADLKEVKRILNDEDRWVNPSKYLADSRKKIGVTVKKLKEHPGFTWIDPKGTAKD